MTILVVDDNEQNLELLEAVLGGNGYQVATAADGVEALEKAREAPPDLIISDTLMPVMDGFALCREWKKDKRLRQIPFIFYTATFTDERDRAFALSLGADKFIVKPQEPKVLLHTVMEVIKQVRSPSAAPSEPAECMSTRALIESAREEESRHLKGYSEVLVRKLESKMAQLEEANHELERNSAERQAAAETLRNSEVRYRRLFEAAKDGILILDAETGTVVDVNPFLMALLGYSREMFLGKKIWELGFFKDIVANQDNFAELQRKKYIRYEDMPLKASDGRQIHVEFVSNVYLANHHKVIQCNIRDITERKRAADALKKSEERFAQTAEQSQTMVWETDGNGLYTYVSGMAETLLGYRPDEIVGKKHFYDLHPADGREEFKRAALAVFASKEPFRDLLNPAETRDGRILWLSTNGAPVLDTNGNLLGYRGSDSDITERKRAEAEILFKNALLEAQSETTIDGILAVDEHGKTILSNGRFAEMWGIPREILETGDDDKVLQSVIARLCDPESFLAGVKHLYSHTEEKSRDEIELKGGKCFDRYSSPLVDRNGTYRGRIWYFRDITDRKQAELALQRVNRALKVTSSCNMALVRATDEQSLLDEVCRILITVGAYDFAWVGFVEQDGRKMGPRGAFAGRDNAQPLFFGGVSPEESECRPADVAIRTGQSCILQCGENERAPNPCQVRMRKAGYSAVAAFPMFIEGSVLGVLGMYAKDAHAFAEDEIWLLSEMADDLAFGIQTIRARAAHAKAVETLRENEERYHHLFESLYDAAFLADGATGIILDANQQAEVLLGKDRDEIIGLYQSELHPPEKAAEYRKMFAEHAAQDIAVHEAEVIRRDGTIVPVSISASTLMIGGAHLVLGLFRDISAAKQAETRLTAGAAKLHQMMESSIKAMGSVVEARDPYTAGHERRVAQLAFAIAGEMGLDESQSEGIRIAGYVHDIGKIAVPAEILSKPGKISVLEFGIIKVHPQSGYDILKEIDFVWPVALATLQHHERLDGSGYPQGLKGDEIITEAKILAVADVVEAMSSHRPYRAALGVSPALEEITQKKGLLYDPAAVDACVSLFKDKGFHFD